ncbi:TRAFAC clade GTPase domain-containing protein [Massilia sp. LXY-6]|uniref:TRAFAC clade GTPase domain-containing protein n=1 Tax=Massilia sp. LXY-6 TaxID=3379823 RepID=UPI003EE41662
MDVVTEASPHQCANPDCQVAMDGRCVEGVSDLKLCPHYGRAVLIIEDTKSESAAAVSRGLRLPDADALSVTGAQTVLRNQACSVIAIIGPHESGKTSLIGGIYDLLQYGPVGGYVFAGSTTLHSFERACHDSRTASNREEPHMERTATGEATYFHLDLVQAKGRSKRAALFANRAGEDYMDTHSDPDLAKSFVELRRSDTLTLLADGVKLLDDRERHLVREDICQSIRAFHEAGQTRTWQRLAVVLTKVDAVRQNQEKCQRVLRHFDSIVMDVREQFSNDFVEIQAFQVAASPKNEMAERGEGMVELLSYWMSAPGCGHVKVGPMITVPLRSFGRLRPTISGGLDE